MTKGGVTLYAMFYHPVYEEGTGAVAMAEFEFSPPASAGQVASYRGLVCPLCITRGPTHTQTIKPDASDPCAPSQGGKDTRWTQDWIIEEHYCPGGGGICLLRMYNDLIR